jgi:hypothetical protein
MVSFYLIEAEDYQEAEAAEPSLSRVRPPEGTAGAIGPAGPKRMVTVGQCVHRRPAPAVREPPRPKRREASFASGYCGGPPSMSSYRRLRPGRGFIWETNIEP